MRSHSQVSWKSDCVVCPVSRAERVRFRRQRVTKGGPQVKSKTAAEAARSQPYCLNRLSQLPDVSDGLFISWGRRVHLVGGYFRLIDPLLPSRASTLLAPLSPLPTSASGVDGCWNNE